MGYNAKYLNSKILNVQLHILIKNSMQITSLNPVILKQVLLLFQTFKECDNEIIMEMNVVRQHVEGWSPLEVLTGPFTPIMLDPKILTSYYGMVTNSSSNNDEMYQAEMATHRLVLV